MNRGLRGWHGCWIGERARLACGFRCPRRNIFLTADDTNYTDGVGLNRGLPATAAIRTDSFRGEAGRQRIKRML